MKSLSYSFYNRSAVKVAQEVLGCVVVHKTKKGTIAGKIVETEAYLHNDSASHSFRGMTKRNAPMFGKAGKAYVYFTYGMHHCFNIVCNKQGKGEAVLIRALEPLQGISIMKRSRKTEERKQLCNGPAKLVQALRITKEHNAQDITSGKLRIIKGDAIQRDTIVKTTRIGISSGKEKKLRFYIQGNEFVSRK